MAAQNTRRTISIDTKIYHRLSDAGKFGESFSELVGRLLDELDTAQKLQNSESVRRTRQNEHLEGVLWILDTRNSISLNDTPNDNIISAKALRVKGISSSQNKTEFRTRCPQCNSRVIVAANRGAYFCEAEDRRLHEERCVDRLKKLVDDCNWTEFSSFHSLSYV